MKIKTAIAISGGVDSLVAAYILKEQGRDLFGIHFLTGYETPPPAPEHGGASSFTFLEEQLGIRIHILDCRREFENTVVNYFYRQYRNGLTPNPCMVCNPRIKFGAVRKAAEELGAESLATGHYASLLKDAVNRFHLLTGWDVRKDQSYFLAMMTQQQLASAVFPMGAMTKQATYELAQKKGFTPLYRHESQDVCFIQHRNYHEFLSEYSNITDKPGLIVDMKGNIIGEHKGIHRYTIGQRRGINCPSSHPYYVVQIDSKNNRIMVGEKKDLMRSEFNVQDINWINAIPDAPFPAHTRVRYRSRAFPSTVIPVNKKSAVVRCHTPQSSLTPGQAAVFYKENEVLGGGWIQPFS